MSSKTALKTLHGERDGSEMETKQTQEEVDVVTYESNARFPSQIWAPM